MTVEMEIDHSEKLAAIESAVRKLIKEPAVQDAIPLSHAIPAFAREILMRSYNTAKPKEPTEAELEQALDIIGRIREHRYVGTDALSNFRVSAHIILGTAVGAKPSSKKGRPPKADSAAVTEICGEIFYALTDKKPTPPAGPDNRYSKCTTPFVEFLEEIFGILGLDASAKSCAKVLDDRWREHCSGNEGNNPIKFILRRPRIGD